MKTKQRWRNAVNAAVKRFGCKLKPAWTAEVNVYMTGHEGDGHKVARKIGAARHVIKHNFIATRRYIWHLRWRKGEREDMKINVLFVAYRPVAKKDFDALNAEIAKLGYKFDWEDAK